MKILDSATIEAQLAQKRNPFWPSYKAMYSSWFGGIVTDPRWMMVPMDDHLVHRGDGVFEAIKVVQGKMWLAGAHLERLLRSAEMISLKHSFQLPEIEKICIETYRMTGLNEAMIRVFLSRGPGAFSTNPYDSVGGQLYVVVTEFKALTEEVYNKGVVVGRSQVPPKDPWMAQIKSCNYLPNVMMKKESVDRALDFVVGYTPDGVLTEASTENIILVDEKGLLVRPPLKNILRGTTMMKAFELAESLVERSELQGLSERVLTEADVLSARELMMVGTTLDVLPVRQYEQVLFPDFTIAKKLRELLKKNQGK